MILSCDDWSGFQAELVTLFEASFERTIDMDYFDWRYFRNPENKLLFSIERSEGILIASYSASPVRIACGGVSYDSALSMTTMTHPKARGKGLFPKLARELYAEMNQQGTHFVWGFPNANSYPIFKNKLDWEDITEIPALNLTVDSSSVRKYQLSDLVHRDDDFLFSYPRLDQDMLIRVHRDRDYLKWRYCDNPVNKYQCFVVIDGERVSSYVVTKSYNQGVDLVDSQVKNEDEAAVILAHVIRFFIDSGIARFCCWAPSHHFVHGILERFGFMQDVPVTYFCGKSLIESSKLEGWNDCSSWYIQMGDSDVY